MRRVRKQAKVPGGTIRLSDLGAAQHLATMRTSIQQDIEIVAAPKGVLRVRAGDYHREIAGLDKIAVEEVRAAVLAGLSRKLAEVERALVDLGVRMVEESD